MKTVKDVKEFIKNLPDDMLVFSGGIEGYENLYEMEVTTKEGMTGLFFI